MPIHAFQRDLLFVWVAFGLMKFSCIQDLVYPHFHGLHKKKKHGLLLPGYSRLLVVGFAHLSITIGFLGGFSLFGADSRVTQGWQQW